VPELEWVCRKTEAIARYKVFAEIVTTEHQSINWLLEQLQYLQDLLTILIGEPIQKLQLVGQLDRSDTNSDTSQVIHVFHSVPAPKPLKKIVPESMISAYALGDNLSHVISAWFRAELFELWTVLRDIYFGGVVYNDTGASRFRLLALTQALESYHRLKFGGEYLSKEDYEPTREEICKAIPKTLTPPHRDSLKNRVKYGYQYSLSKRFGLLLDLLDESQQKTLGIRKSDKVYIKRIIASRNYYTHYDPEDAPSAFEGRELEQINVRLTHMFIVLLLKEEMKIPQDLIAKLLSYRKGLGRLW
jgi:hypothetical protein